jgi:hypothetical protein
LQPFFLHRPCIQTHAVQYFVADRSFSLSQSAD